MQIFIPRGQTEIKAMRGGLTIRLCEWTNLKKSMADIDSTY